MHADNRIACNEGWLFQPVFGGTEEIPVRLPHEVGKLPLHYADPSDYSGIVGYRKMLFIPEEGKEKRHFLQFDGAAHIAQVFVNGTSVAEHQCGYTAFRAELTDALLYGAENEILVKLDTTENPAIPPFGYVIDYLTYGGLYREVWYEERPKTYIEDVFITTPRCNKVSAEIRLSDRAQGIRLSVREKGSDADLASKEIFFSDRSAALPEDGDDEAGETFTLDLTVPGAKLWDLDTPNLYTLTAELLADGETVDAVSDTFGFRLFTWKENSFYLNGRPVMLRGLNRHQSYAHIGYAAPERLQREDSRILKEELSCNAVRTSHYPQSHHFIDACDELGLLVFTEIPGWQHIGDEAWKDQAVENTREMVEQYRNHPSVFLWGVRINESVDDDAFYERTNALAHALDPTRATSGVRYLEKSSLLEDVYAYNDFSHNGKTPGAKPKNKVTTHPEKPLLISESNGHMFPTKTYDPWEKRQEHALRHARVMAAAMNDGGHAGVFQWCMFDYQTHKDFGSGDKICYHGVMDIFRNPKLAASVYASQGEKPHLAVGCPMDIGDYPAGSTGEIYAFTNADEIRLYKNGAFVASFRADGFEGLPHPPVRIDDFVGELLKTQEGYDDAKANLLHACLLSAKEYGMANMPAADKAKMAFAMVRYGLKFEDGVKLYGKYVANWGGEATRWRFDAVKDGQVIASETKCPGTRLHIEADVCSVPQGDGAEPVVLREGDTYDMCPVRIRIVDENGNPAPYAQVPVALSLEGEAELIGPAVIVAEGGMCGTYVKTSGKLKEGETEAFAELTIMAEDMPEVRIRFRVIS